MTEFEKKLRAAAGKCLEEDEAMFRSLESQETPILRTKRTERRNTMSNWIILIPTILTIIICLWSKNVYVGMFVGIFSGCII